MASVKTSLLFGLLSLATIWANKPWTVQVRCVDESDCITPLHGEPASSFLRPPDETYESDLCYDPAFTFRVRLVSIEIDTVVSCRPTSLRALTTWSVPF